MQEASLCLCWDQQLLQCPLQHPPAPGHRNAFESWGHDSLLLNSVLSQYLKILLEDFPGVSVTLSVGSVMFKVSLTCLNVFTLTPKAQSPSADCRRALTQCLHLVRGIWVSWRIQLCSYVLHEKGGTQSSKAIQVLVAFLYNTGVHLFRANRAHRNQQVDPLWFNLKPVAGVILYRDF